MREKAAPVNGVGAREGNLAGAHQLFGKCFVAENILGTRLAIIEIALYCPDHDIGTCLGCHLFVLDVANTAVGVHYRNLDAIFVAESFESSLAGVARGGNQDKEGVFQLSLFAQLRRTCAKEMGQALQRHILKSAGGTMPQLKNMGVFIERCNGAYRFIVETVAVGRVHELVDLSVRQIDAKRAIDEGCALGIGDFRQ